jgi:hypothetical protein
MPISRHDLLEARFLQQAEARDALEHVGGRHIVFSARISSASWRSGAIPDACAY